MAIEEINKRFMIKAILGATITGIAVAGSFIYFVRRSKKRKQDEFTAKQTSFKYVGDRTHNSLHEIL